MDLIQSDLLFAAKQVLSSLPLAEELTEKSSKEFRLMHGRQVVHVDVNQLVQDVLAWSSEDTNSDPIKASESQDPGCGLKRFVDSCMASVFIDTDLTEMRVTGLSGLLIALTDDGKLYPVCINKVFVHQTTEVTETYSSKVEAGSVSDERTDAYRGQAQAGVVSDELVFKNEEESQDEKVSSAAWNKKQPARNKKKKIKGALIIKEESETPFIKIEVPDHILDPLPSSLMKLQELNESVVEEVEEAKPQKSKKSASLRRDWSCKICDEKPTCQSAYYRHLGTHSEAEVEQLKIRQVERKKRGKWNVPLAKEEHGKIVCGVCGEHFKAMEYYRRHYQKHMGIVKKKYYYPPKRETGVCQYCGKSMYKPSLPQHIREKHTEKGPYVCPRCSAVYNQYRTFQIHVAQHDGNKLYRCEVCCKTLRSAMGYRDHMNMHQGVHPYTCDFCGRTFVHNSVWRKHRRTHTHAEEQQEVTCDQCGTVLKNLRAYQAHLSRIHRVKRLGYGQTLDTAEASPSPPTEQPHNELVTTDLPHETTVTFIEGQEFQLMNDGTITLLQI